MLAPLVHVAAAALLAFNGAAPPASASDQQRVSDALASSSLRLLESNFWSVGPGTRDDDFVSACLGGIDSPAQLARFPGELARGVSNVYLHQDDADGRPEDGELVSIAVVVVDAANVSALDSFIALLGDDDTGACRRDELLRAAERDAGADGLQITVDEVAIADLGIGERSARLDLRITFARPGSSRLVHDTYLVGRTDTTMVVLSSATFGSGPTSGFDPETELTTLLAELGRPDS